MFVQVGTEFLKLNAEKKGGETLNIFAIYSKTLEKLARLREEKESSYLCSKLKDGFGSCEHYFEWKPSLFYAEDSAKHLFLHKKSEGLYEVVEYNAVQEATGEEQVVYKSLIVDRVWVRPKSEFFDGRFSRIVLEE